MRVRIAENLFSAAGLTFERDGDLMRFTIPGRPDPIDATVIEGELELIPERSAAHRALIAAIGLEPV